MNDKRERDCLIFLPGNAKLNFENKEQDALETQYDDRSTDYGRDNVETLVRGKHAKNNQKSEAAENKSTGL